MPLFFFRLLLLIFATTASFVSSAVTSAVPPISGMQSTIMQKKLLELEASSGGRIGLSAINTANNEQIEYRADERFAFCSTFKMMGVSAVLKQSMANASLLQQKIMYKKNNMVNSWSPVTEKHITDGMTISDLCAAAIKQSDNTAINLLLKQLGGPKAVTKFARSIGDDKFRLDRIEPDLNSAIPGDQRDTTTPNAMTNSLQKLSLGNALATSQQIQLQTWLKANTTGDLRIRAGVPKWWVVGDKTGTGAYGTTNDIGIIWPPNCKPIVITIYFTQNKQNAAPRDDIIATTTRMIISEFAKTDRCIQQKL